MALPEARSRLLATPGIIDPALLHALPDRTMVGDESLPVEFLPLDATAGGAGAVVYLPSRQVLFAGPLVVHGPRSRLPGSDTAAWVAALRRLEVLGAKHVVPGFGSWGGPEQIVRQRRFLAELRRQVGYQISQGRPRADLLEQIRIPSDDLVWMPYDNPTAEDIEHVYQ